MQMLGEASNDFVSFTSHEGFNPFIWFNGHVHDDVKVIQYCTSYPIVSDFFIERKRQAFKTCHAQR